MLNSGNVEHSGEAESVCKLDVDDSRKIGTGENCVVRENKKNRLMDTECFQELLNNFALLHSRQSPCDALR